MVGIWGRNDWSIGRRIFSASDHAVSTDNSFSNPVIRPITSSAAVDRSTNFSIPPGENCAPLLLATNCASFAAPGN